MSLRIAGGVFQTDIALEQKRQVGGKDKSNVVYKLDFILFRIALPDRIRIFDIKAFVQRFGDDFKSNSSSRRPAIDF